MTDNTKISFAGWHNAGALDPLHVHAMITLGKAIKESHSPDSEPSNGTKKQVNYLNRWMCRVATDPIFIDPLLDEEEGESLFPKGVLTLRLELRRFCAALAQQLVTDRMSITKPNVASMYQKLEVINEKRLMVAWEKGTIDGAKK